MPYVQNKQCCSCGCAKFMCVPHGGRHVADSYANSVQTMPVITGVSLATLNSCQVKRSLLGSNERVAHAVEPCLTGGYWNATNISSSHINARLGPSFLIRRWTSTVTIPSLLPQLIHIKVRISSYDLGAARAESPTKLRKHQPKSSQLCQPLEWVLVVEDVAEFLQICVELHHFAVIDGVASRDVPCRNVSVTSGGRPWRVGD